MKAYHTWNLSYKMELLFWTRLPEAVTNHGVMKVKIIKHTCSTTVRVVPDISLHCDRLVMEATIKWKNV